MMFLRFVLSTISISLLLAFSSCDEPITTVPENDEQLVLKINHFYKNAPFLLNQVYTSSQGRDLWITKKKYYISNITAINLNGKNELIQDVALIEVIAGESTVSITGNIPKGSYTAISFDLGVREDLNMTDPATYDINHPLSITNNMYWGWSTQYIFSKFEGKEILNNDTTSSFVIHTGTQKLYRPEIIVQRVFEVKSGDTEISIDLDIFSILSNSEYTFDLTKDGQSHTVDNLPLAANYMDNFTVAFE